MKEKKLIRKVRKIGKKGAKKLKKQKIKNVPSAEKLPSVPWGLASPSANELGSLLNMKPSAPTRALNQRLTTNPRSFRSGQWHLRDGNIFHVVALPGSPNAQT